MAIDKEGVIREAELIARPAMERLSKGEIHLHNSGYSAWSAAMANMRNKIEKALYELIEELEN